VSLYPLVNYLYDIQKNPIKYFKNAKKLVFTTFIDLLWSISEPLRRGINESFEEESQP